MLIRFAFPVTVAEGERPAPASRSLPDKAAAAHRWMFARVDVRRMDVCHNATVCEIRGDGKMKKPGFCDPGPA